MRLGRYLKETKWYEILLPSAVLFIASCALTLVMCMISEGTVTEAFIMPNLWAFALNVLFVYAIMMVLYLFIRKTWIAFLPPAVFFTVVNYLDYYKILIRGETILPCDLTILGEAAETSGLMTFEYNSGILVGVLIVLAVSVALFFYDILIKKAGSKKTGWLRRLISGTCVLIIAILGVRVTLINPAFLASADLTPYQWRQTVTRNNNGFIVNFLANIPFMIPEKPSDYSEETMTQLLDTVTEEVGEKETAETDTPNIIVIMNESFIDAEKFANIEFDSELTPMLRSIAETKTGGSTFTPQFGGGTANVEFETLTGYSLSFLPASSTPYQQHIDKETNSYVSFLRDSLGYSTVAIHSYGAHFWNRDEVYPLIGFDKFVSEEDFVLPIRMRGFISDSSTTDMIIYEYEENLETGKPFFNFTVTMQNHGSYSASQYDEYYLVGSKSDALDEKVLGAITCYATNIKYADDALSTLINYFSKVDEPTIIVFFGDHMGSFGNKDNSYFKGGYTQYPEGTAENYFDLHTPPFVIWDNYTDVSGESVTLSNYYLLPYMTELYDLPQPLYFSYLNMQMDYICGTADTYALNSEGEIILRDDIGAEAELMLDRQQLIQYDGMFGKGYVSDKMWSVAE